MVYSMLHINSISFSALKLLAGVRLMRRLRCPGLFLTLLSLRCVLSPRMVGGTESLCLVCPCTS
jgi:hypothetical protein